MYKKTEKKLIEYYQNKHVIRANEYKLKMLNEQIGVLGDKLKHTQVSIPEQSFNNNWDAPGGTGGNSSHIERSLIRVIDDMNGEMGKKIELMYKLESEIDGIRVENAVLDYHINQLSDDERKLIYYKYDKCLTDLQVSIRLYCSREKITKLKRKVVTELNTINVPCEGF